MGEYRNGKWTPTWGDDQFGVSENNSYKQPGKRTDAEWQALLGAAQKRIQELEQQSEQDRRRMDELKAFISGVGNNCNAILRKARDEPG